MPSIWEKYTRKARTAGERLELVEAAQERIKEAVELLEIADLGSDAEPIIHHLDGIASTQPFASQKSLDDVIADLREQERQELSRLCPRACA